MLYLYLSQGRVAETSGSLAAEAASVWGKLGASTYRQDAWFKEVKIG